MEANDDRDPGAAEIAAAGDDPAVVLLVRRSGRGEAGSAVALDRALGRVGHGIRVWPLALFGIGHPPEVLRPFLADRWDTGESPSDLGTGRIVRLFRRAGFAADDDGVAAPTEPSAVDRGVPVGGRVRGPSWTLDRDTAAWFARSWSLRSPRAVVAAEAPPRHRVGAFLRRREAGAVGCPRGPWRTRTLGSSRPGRCGPRGPGMRTPRPSSPRDAPAVGRGPRRRAPVRGRSIGVEQHVPMSSASARPARRRRRAPRL